MITIRNLNISYSKNVRVISSLNLTIKEKTINGIVGLNGSGKTTLLNAMFGLKKIDSGEICCDKTKITKKQIAYLLSENYFYTNITGSEYLSLFKDQYFKEDNWNEIFSLPLNRIIDNYSSGMKKKLALLGLLKQDKPIIILDEPFNGLDLESCRILRSILLRLKEKGKTIIITSHIIETLTNLCDYIHYLENGRIMYSKEKNEFDEFEKEIFMAIENKNKSKIQKLI